MQKNGNNTMLSTFDFYEHLKNIATNKTDYKDSLPELSERPIFPELDSPFTFNKINVGIAD